ncbi:hypothetical protein [Streptomyces sp. NPDC053427]|uniref:hypothetical protein n=1 Tax=Streptomyces sp. NPDC053427 TaxID=3365701 RepID=UPI0037D2A249
MTHRGVVTEVTRVPGKITASLCGVREDGADRASDDVVCDGADRPGELLAVVRDPGAWCGRSSSGRWPAT